MSKERSAEYTKLSMDIFLLGNVELHEQLDRCTERMSAPEDIYEADITYGEWEYLLLTALAYRREVGLHDDCAVCNAMTQQLLEESV